MYLTVLIENVYFDLQLFDCFHCLILGNVSSYMTVIMSCCLSRKNLLHYEHVSTCLWNWKCQGFFTCREMSGDRPKSGMCQKSLVLENAIASLTYCSMVLHWWMVEGHVLPALSICCLSGHCGVFPRICTDICHVLVSVFSNSDK